jgi:hypothetical protein
MPICRSLPVEALASQFLQVQAFHNSACCAAANRRLIGRRHALQRAWKQFTGDQQHPWSPIFGD